MCVRILIFESRLRFAGHCQPLPLHPGNPHAAEQGRQSGLTDAVISWKLMVERGPVGTLQRSSIRMLLGGAGCPLFW